MLTRRQFALGTLALGTSLTFRHAPAAEAKKQPSGPPLVTPGSGIRIAKTGDDFEQLDWNYYPSSPKSSWNIDENMRVPGGISKNNLWVEAGKRGQPDMIRRVITPPAGIPGSIGSMCIQTLQSGIPGRPSGQQQQDDLLHNTQGQVGRTIPVSWTPNCICRVYMPPVSQWENRVGPTFGYRVGLLGWGKKSTNEEYWPGMFIHMERGTNKSGERTYGLRVYVRGDGYGRDLPGPVFEPEEWATLGMTCSPDGQVHFFARKGVDDLETGDCIGSYWPYSYRAHSFQTFFFNVINQDDGHSISTPWVIDDAMLYAASAPTSKIRGVPPAQSAEKPADKPAEKVAENPTAETEQK
ncbi:MAG: hypothetical protein SFU86_12970 [Pirellulaceae bacterium]|nr:hypothetical protein [Pirellulaceae bacterium]